MLLTDVLKDEDDEERRDQVVDALDVAAGRMTDGPDEEDPLKNLSYANKHKQGVRTQRSSSEESYSLFDFP